MSIPPPNVVQQPFPRLNTPLVNDDGTPSFGWYRLLISLWQKLGGNASNTAAAVYLQTDSSGNVDAYAGATGKLLGIVPLGDVVGGPVQPVAPTVSGMTYKAAVSGILIVFGARVDVSRDGLNYYPCSLTGGQITLQRNDIAKITWFSAAPPQLSFFPSV